ncbi:hypothetical protein L5515_006253 [Caenorhabditis briggsae]|uniref:Protein clpf-1 n=1 Tax=Caenorhabditis briggsae TaxID=6238 RepID=A0AAE9EVI8_CAEBR|nr:hypothetical protein L5515_006253 [Caenorhabditis briggsae]
MFTERVQRFDLNSGCELRFVANNFSDISLELLNGYAEIFGTELIPNQKYVFPAKFRAAVFSWTGGTIEIKGDTESAYISSESTAMVVYLNIHATLEKLRKDREASGKDTGVTQRGPRILLVGPTDVGKTTVSRILCNYAVRKGGTPILVDLDVGQNNISVPGSIGAMLVQKTADFVDGFERNMPLVLNFGHTSPGENLPLYEALLKALATTMNAEIEENPAAKLGGMIINTCGWVDGGGYTCILKSAAAFEVDVVVVIDHERLYNVLRRDLPDFVTVTHVPKSGGVEQRPRHIRKIARRENVHRYFYGTSSNQLYPFTLDLSFDAVVLCKIGAEPLPDSCLSFGMEVEDHRTKVVALEPSLEVKNHLFAFSRSSNVDANVLTFSVWGFCVVTEIDMEKRSLTILCPQNSIPSNILVYSVVTHLDDQLRR